MERIVLEVDGATARAWKNTSPNVRQEYESKITAMLKGLQETEQIDEDGFTKEQRDFLAKEAAENTERYEWWNDEEMLAELDRRSADLKSGKDKGITLEEVKERLAKRTKKA